MLRHNAPCHCKPSTSTLTIEPTLSNICLMSVPRLRYMHAPFMNKILPCQPANQHTQGLAVQVKWQIEEDDKIESLVSACNVYHQKSYHGIQEIRRRHQRFSTMCLQWWPATVQSVEPTPSHETDAEANAILRYCCQIHQQSLNNLSSMQHMTTASDMKHFVTLRQRRQKWSYFLKVIPVCPSVQH